MNYEDFVIQIGTDRGDGHPVQVLRSPAGEGAGRFQLPLEPDQIETVLRRAGLHRVRGASAVAAGAAELREVDTELPPAEREAAETIGGQLFRALFSDQIRSLYDQSMGTVRSRPGHGLRIRLKLDARDRDLSRLSSIPWELLWREETQHFLSLSKLSPIVRYLDVPEPAAPIRIPSVLRILVAISNPRGLTPLDLAEETRELASTCRGWKGVEVTFLEDASPASLRRALSEKAFHVLHFMGHGGFDGRTGEGVLYFQKADGTPEPVTGHALATLLKEFKSLGLVLLNACETARATTEGLNPFSGVASALVLGGLPAVVAMQFPISDQAAIAFSTAFYQSLAAGDPVDAAMVEGRQEILSIDTRSLEWATPVLFLRVPDGAVFLSPQARRRKDGAEEERSSRSPSWRKLALALFLVVSLLSLGVILFRSLPATAAGHVLEIGQEFADDRGRLEGVLTQAELLDNGRMRLHFRFRNDSPQEAKLGLDYLATYLADAAGNRYPVLATDAARMEAVQTIPPGGEVERWLEVPAPLDRARGFQVKLASRGPDALRFSLFSLKLPEYPRELSRSSPNSGASPGSLALAVAQSFATGIAGLRGDLRGVELQPNGRMRWSFSFLNGSDSDQEVGFDYQQVYLEDEYGNRYPVLASDTGGHAGQIYRKPLPQALRTDHWFEFAAPRNKARKFKVVLASHNGKSLRFSPFDAQLPYYPDRYSIRSQPPAQKEPARHQAGPPVKPTGTLAAPVDPPAQTVPGPEPDPVPPAQTVQEEEQGSPVLTPGTIFGTSVKGLTGKLTSVKRLPDGRLRCNFELFNESGGPAEIGFDFENTYLADNQGNRYKVLRTDRGPVSQKVPTETLAVGASVAHWLEVPPLTKGARWFLIVFSSHNGHGPKALRFNPVLVELPAGSR